MGGQRVDSRRRVLVIGGGFSGLVQQKDLSTRFHVTIVDQKEFFEYTPGILRCYVKPQHFDQLSFTLQDVIEHKMGCKFIWGEVKNLIGEKQVQMIKPMFTEKLEQVQYDYCVVQSGCNFNFLHPKGESLWFPTVHEEQRPLSLWPHIDERFIEGRRRHILEENQKIQELNKKKQTVLVQGQGFIGVEWATELQYFFPNLQITIIDFLPNCLGPLPPQQQQYCDKYMDAKGIKKVYGIKYEPKNPEFWKKLGMDKEQDITYICMGVKQSNYFMPSETLSKVGPGGGKWIVINKHLQVMNEQQNKVWGNGVVFQIGDCNFGCIGGPQEWKVGKGMPPIPKISYPSEEQQIHTVKNIKILDNQKYNSGGQCECLPKQLASTWWPWGQGMFQTSLGVDDACFVLQQNHQPKSGYLTLWGYQSQIQKELIETTKVNECRGGTIGQLIWHFVHRTPVHLWGKGSFYSFKN